VVNNWTQDELAILRERYHEGLEAVQTFLPWRTEAAIRKQASLQNVTDEKMSTRKDKSAAPLPAMDLYQQLACLRLRKWKAPVFNNAPLVGWRIA